MAEEAEDKIVGLEVIAVTARKRVDEMIGYGVEFDSEFMVIDNLIMKLLVLREI